MSSRENKSAVFGTPIASVGACFQNRLSELRKAGLILALSRDSPFLLSKLIRRSTILLPSALNPPQATIRPRTNAFELAAGGVGSVFGG